MIPQLVSVRWDRRRLHVPVLPILLVLAPLLVLGLVVAALIVRVDPVGALRGAGRVLCALPGTRLEIESGPTAIHLHIR